MLIIVKGFQIQGYSEETYVKNSEKRKTDILEKEYNDGSGPGKTKRDLGTMNNIRPRKVCVKQRVECIGT